MRERDLVIIEWFLTSVMSAVEWALSGFPGWDAPSWFVDFDSTVNSMYGTLSGLGAYINFTAARDVITVVFAAWAIFFSIRLARVGLGHVPGVGGNG